jgi:hypothetical protein
MKRYLIFAAIGPALGGFLLLGAMTWLSGYWTTTNYAEVRQFLLILFSTLQYSYLFALLPSLAIAAIDDILSHYPQLQWPARMVLCSSIAFVATAFMYSGRGADSGFKQFVLYGMVGLIPTLLNCWLCRHIRPKELMAQA